MDLDVILVTLVVEAIIWGVAKFREALARPSRRAISDLL